MKVLMTLDAVGGVWRYAMDLGTELAGRDCEVVFAGLGPPPAPGQRAEAPGRLLWGEAPLDWTVAGPEDLATVGPWLSGLVRQHRPDLVQVNLPSQAAGLRIERPVVAVCHSCLATWFRAVEGTAPPPGFAWHERLTRAGLARASAVVAPSAAQARAVETAYGMRGVVAVENATRLAPRPPGGGQGIVAAGRWWDRGKNGAVLVAAAERCRWPVTLIGATGGPDGQRLEPGATVAPGALPHAETAAAIAAAGIFVSPSLYEPFGLAALEAARLGRPLVLADIPTYRELWDGAALFFDPRDPMALAALLDRLVPAEEERGRLGRLAQARAAGFTPARQAEGMLALYQRLVAAEAVA